jgi:membrane protease subunit (stomatin/prohibitin family)
MDRLWQRVRSTFIDVIEWTHDDPGAGGGGAGGGADTLVWRFDRQGGAIRMGAQLIVREGQWAVFVNEGRITDGFGPGRHQLSTRNLPLLTNLLCLPYGFESPFKAEVIFVATRLFTDLRWGTRHPLIVRDPELGPVRLRGFGTYTLRVNDPGWLVREISGSRSRFGLDDISEQLRNLIVSRLADLLGKAEHPITSLAGHYDELARELRLRLAEEVQEYGLEMPTLLIENLTLPPEVEAALDRRSSRALSGEPAAGSGAAKPPLPPPLSAPALAPPSQEPA